MPYDTVTGRCIIAAVSVLGIPFSDLQVNARYLQPKFYAFRELELHLRFRVSELANLYLRSAEAQVRLMELTHSYISFGTAVGPVERLVVNSICSLHQDLCSS